MRGRKKRAWYQMHTHALDIASFIPSVTVSSMTNDVFTEDDLLQHHKPRPVPQNTIVQALVSDVPLATYTGQVS